MIRIIRPTALAALSLLSAATFVSCQSYGSFCPREPYPRVGDRTCS